MAISVDFTIGSNFITWSSKESWIIEATYSPKECKEVMPNWPHGSKLLLPASV